MLQDQFIQEIERKISTKSYILEAIEKHEQPAVYLLKLKQSI